MLKIGLERSSALLAIVAPLGNHVRDNKAVYTGIFLRIYTLRSSNNPLLATFYSHLRVLTLCQYRFERELKDRPV